MQTFLPYPDFAASVGVLDDRRLGKQRVETYQILRALLFTKYAWKNHPAVRMWRGFVPALVSYGIAACETWTARGHADSVRESLLEFTGGVVPDEAALASTGRLPPWLGRPELHLSHQSALLRKDPDAYRGAFHDVPDDLPYFWPPDCFPRWPFRRPGPEPVDPESALAAAGFANFRPGQREAVEAIATGEDAYCSLPAGGGATSTGLMAAMTRSVVALWVWPGDRIAFTPRPADAVAATPDAPQGAGAAAPSMARPPTREDTASVEAEIAAEQEHVFVHASQLGDAQFLRQLSPYVGLLVVESAGQLTATDQRTLAEARLLLPGAPLLSLNRSTADLSGSSVQLASAVSDLPRSRRQASS